MNNYISGKRKTVPTHLMALIVINIILLILMQIFKSNYLLKANLLTISRSVAITSLIGFSQMVCMSSGAMNLSVGGMGAMAGVMAGLVMERMGASAFLAILTGLGAACVCGLFNALLIYRNGGVGVASFLVTLASDSVFYGVILTITKSQPFYGIKPAFVNIGMKNIGVISNCLIITFVVAVILWIFYNKSRMGKQLLAFGSNWKSAELYGTSKFKVILVTNVLCALITGIAGLMTVMRLDSAPSDIGSNWMLTSFSAALIGGCLVNGGKVSIFGTMLGALILTIVDNALVYLQVSVYWYDLFEGAIILLVVAINVFSQVRMVRSRKLAKSHR